MSSNVRRRDRVCFEEDDEEEDDEQEGLLARIRSLLRDELPCHIPYVIVGIVSVMFAFYLHNRSQRKTIREINANISDIKDTMCSRLDDIEKAVMRLASYCETPGDEEEIEAPVNDDTTDELIKKHLRKYDADKTGMIDWALESLGGSVVSVKGTESYVLGGTSILGMACTKYTSDPGAIIRPSTMPGDCWAFKGEGNILIRLVTSIYVSNFTLEHIPQEMSPYGEITSAPKIFLVFGSPDPENGDGTRHCFGQFEYKSSGDPVQIFPVQNPCYNAFDIIEFNFKSNHGNKDFTCIYRVRVHGQLSLDFP